MEDGRHNLVVEMIGAAVMAGAYRAMIRQDQGLAAGFGKLATKHSRAATRLADEVCGAANGQESDAARFVCGEKAPDA